MYTVVVDVWSTFINNLELAMAKEELSFTKDEWMRIVQALKTQAAVHKRAAKAEPDQEISQAYARKESACDVLANKIATMSLV